MSLWINCQDAMPPMPTSILNEKDYLITTKQGMVLLKSYAGGFGCTIDIKGKVDRTNEIKDVVAWMPLPEPYERR